MTDSVPEKKPEARYSKPGISMDYIQQGGKGVFVPFLMWKLGEISPVEANNYLDKRS